MNMVIVFERLVNSGRQPGIYEGDDDDFLLGKIGTQLANMSKYLHDRNLTLTDVMNYHIDSLEDQGKI